MNYSLHLPAGWKSNISSCDRDWIGHSLFSDKKGKLTANLKQIQMTIHSRLPQLPHLMLPVMALLSRPRLLLRQRMQPMILITGSCRTSCHGPPRFLLSRNGVHGLRGNAMVPRYKERFVHLEALQVKLCSYCISSTIPHNGDPQEFQLASPEPTEPLSPQEIYYFFIIFTNFTTINIKRPAWIKYSILVL